MMALPHHAQAGRLRFEKLPTRHRRILAGAVCLLVAAIFLFTVATGYHRSQPGYVLEILDQINSPADAERYSGYFTPQGKAVADWMLAQTADKPHRSHKTVISDPVVTGAVCDVRIESDEVTMTVRLIKNGRWQFHDLRFDSAGDQQIDMWASYMKDHPYLTQLKLHWHDLIDACLDGVLLGAKMLK